MISYLALVLVSFTAFVLLPPYFDRWLTDQLVEAKGLELRATIVIRNDDRGTITMRRADDPHAPAVPFEPGQTITFKDTPEQQDLRLGRFARFDQYSSDVPDLVLEFFAVDDELIGRLVLPARHLQYVSHRRICIASIRLPETRADPATSYRLAWCFSSPAGATR